MQSMFQMNTAFKWIYPRMKRYSRLKSRLEMKKYSTDLIEMYVPFHCNQHTRNSNYFECMF